MVNKVVSTDIAKYREQSTTTGELLSCVRLTRPCLLKEHGNIGESTLIKHKFYSHNRALPRWNGCRLCICGKICGYWGPQVKPDRPVMVVFAIAVRLTRAFVQGWNATA